MLLLVHYLYKGLEMGVELLGSVRMFDRNIYGGIELCENYFLLYQLSKGTKIFLVWVMFLCGCSYVLGVREVCECVVG